MQLQSVLALIDHYGQPSGRTHGVGGFAKTASSSTLTAHQAGVAMGVGAGIGPNDYQLAARIYRQVPATQTFIGSLSQQVGKEIQVQVVGPLAGPRPAPPVHQQRHSTLVPGISVSHFQNTAGTIGGFVTREGSGDVFILSNNHVLANSNSVVDASVSALGDPIVHPGCVDGGSVPNDWVADLADFEPLRMVNTVDAAIAKLRRGSFDCDYGGHQIRGIAPAVQGHQVWKIGRTTSHTTGTVGATNLKYTGIDFPFGMAFFDGVFEVNGLGGRFSRGGDSGSLVLNQADEVVGMVFAGTSDETQDAIGYSLVLPIEAVLRTLNAKLLT